MPLPSAWNRTFTGIRARLIESSTLAFRVAYSVQKFRKRRRCRAGGFAKSYSSFRRLRDRDRFRAWLVRITWRLAINRLRSDRRRSLREAVPVETSITPTPVQSIIAQERAAQFWRAIDALPDKLRLVVVLAELKNTISAKSRLCFACRRVQ